MIALPQYTKTDNEKIFESVHLRKETLTALPFRKFVRKSSVETSFSMVMATLKATITGLPANTATMLTLRIKYENNVAIGYLPNVYNGETITIPVQAQWLVAHQGAIGVECIASKTCTMENASIEWMCVDAPLPVRGEEAQTRDGGAVARSGSAATPTTIVCAPVIVFQGSDYISLEPGDNPGWVKIKLVNGE